jgi:hypothetical protein
LNEPGVDKRHIDLKPYDEIIQYANLDIAVCDIVSKNAGVFMPFFQHFYPFIKDNFNKNYDNLIQFAEKKNSEFNGEVKNFKTGFYGMNINVDYNKVIEKLKESKTILQIL